MRYLANENVPLKAVILLQKGGIDIVSVTDLGPGAKDEEVINIAIKEERIIITFDKDFGQLAHKHRKLLPKGIILLRLTPLSPDYIAEKLENLLRQPLTFEGHLTTVTDKRVRMTSLEKG